MARGKDIWTALSEDIGYNALFNAAMACTTEETLKAALDAYSDGFAGLTSITDVGGGSGVALGEIVARFPNIRGVNFDLPACFVGEHRSTLA